MPRKTPGDRWRYIAFRIMSEAVVPRSDFLDAFLRHSRRTSIGDSFRITVFEDNFGILKVPHRLKDESIDALSSLEAIRGSPCRVITLKTSGTIKTLKEKYLPGKCRNSAWPSD